MVWPLCVAQHVPTSRSLRLALYTLLIIAGAALAATLAIRHAVRQHWSKTPPAPISNWRCMPPPAHPDRTLPRPARGAGAGPAIALDALKARSSPEQQDVLNRKLERSTAPPQSSTLELLDRTGLAVAASNWRLPSSYVGHNYGFRPCFSQTRTQGTGRFYAVGVTSGIPGYFLSSGD